MSKTKKTEHNNLSGLVKNSLATISEEGEQDKHLQVKSKAEGQLALYMPDKPQMMIFYNHFHSIGADAQLLDPEDKKFNRNIMYKWFQTLVVQNDVFPRDMPVNFVLDQFFDAILQQKVEIKGYNLLTHMKAFREWIARFSDDLRAKYWRQQNPKERPKELAPNFQVSKEEEEKRAKERAEMLKKMYGADDVPEHLKKYL